MNQSLHAHAHAAGAVRTKALLKTPVWFATGESRPWVSLGAALSPSRPTVEPAYGKDDLEAMSGAGRPTRFRKPGHLEKRFETTH
jgi:hypothetical protein